MHKYKLKKYFETATILIKTKYSLQTIQKEEEINIEEIKTSLINV